MRHESASKLRSSNLPRLAAVSGLALIMLLSITGCTLQLRTNDDLTVGEALSNLGQAGENAWDDIADWFN